MEKYPIIKYLSLVVLVVLVSGSCKDKDEPQPESVRVSNILKSTSWKLQSVTADGVDQTALFTGFTLSFTDTNYSTTNGGVVWPASGTWAFTNTAATIVKRDDNLEVTLSDLSETSFKMTLTWSKTTLGTGRVASVAGKHMFTMVK